MLANYKIVENKIFVSVKFGINLRSIGGQWIAATKEWKLPIERLSLVEEKIGKLDSKLVKVQVTLENIEHVDIKTFNSTSCMHIYKIDWYVLASKSNRDYPPTLFANLVSGNIPTRGGSTKYPRISASDDSIFEFECYEDFAIRHNLNIK